jgi:Zn-dependent peptidase ImmA (M78 family)/transcriptional regulator with XRE-family HTH domain
MLGKLSPLDRPSGRKHGVGVTSDSRRTEAAAPVDAVALFNRHTLRTARELRGLTQVQLAQSIGNLTAASVSQFENGHSRPAAATLDKLATTLNVPVAFFAAPINASADSEVDGFFRSLRSTVPRDRRQARALVEVVRALTLALEAVTALPELNLPRHPVGADTADADIEAIAQQVRHHWGLELGPVPDVIRCIERNGVVTTRVHTSLDKVDAFCVPYRDRPIIVLGADKGLRDRSRFDAAHELGHLVMHSRNDEGSKVAEQQAHRFAAAFLMPADDIRHELPAKADWPRLLELKVKWQVSIAALLMRAKTLGVMAPNAYTQAYKFMSMRGWRKVEPGRLGAPEWPFLLRAAVEVAASSGVPLEELVEQAGLPLDEVSALLSYTDQRPQVAI